MQYKVGCHTIGPLFRIQSIEIYSVQEFHFYQKVKLIFFVESHSHSSFELLVSQRVNFAIGNICL